MKSLAFIALLLQSLLFISACSHENWYKGASSSHDIRCLQENRSDYEACKEDNKHSYDEYQKAKEALDKQKTP